MFIDRRAVLRALGAGVCAKATAALAAVAAAEAAGLSPAVPSGAADLQAAMSRGTLSSVQLLTPAWTRSTRCRQEPSLPRHITQRDSP